MSAVISSLVCIGLGYLCGSLPWGLWIGRMARGVDVRTLGSGNLGATNVYRSLGPALGIATLLLDVLKGAVPVWVIPKLPIASGFPGGPEACAFAVGVAAVAGHVWSFLASFRGGKGVATTAGVLLAIAPGAFAAFLVVFLVTVALTRYISLGSILGAVAFSITLALRSPAGVRDPAFGFGVVLTLLVIWRHRGNLQRLANGTERRFEWRRGANA